MQKQLPMNTNSYFVERKLCVNCTLTLKYSTKSLQVIVQPFISFIIRFSFASNCGTSSFNCSLKSDSISEKEILG